MKFGVNTFLFTSPFTNDSISLFPKFKKWGFDGVEIAIEDVSHVTPSLIKRALDDNGLKCSSSCAALGEGRDLRGSLKDQNAALDYLKGMLDMMPELGAPVLIGPLYSCVGRAGYVEQEDRKVQWDTVAGHFRTLSDRAEKLGVKMAIEPLNRYETDFINTGDQALKMIEDVGSDALTVLLDSYHMNIEEKDPAKTIIKAGSKLGHFHACGSDRGTPGNDQINWNNISAALNQINYSGSVVIESFTTDVKVIAKAASIWRDFEPSQEDIAVNGLKFLKTLFKN